MQGNNLSPDTINNFSKLLDQMDDMLKKQLEITEKVLQLEGKIATDRMASMNKYFDAYSSALDGVARKQSNLGDGFLILSEKIDKAAKEFKIASDKSDDFKIKGKSSGGGGSDGGKPTYDSKWDGGGGSGPTKPPDKPVHGKLTEKTKDLEETDLGPTPDEVRHAVKSRKEALQTIYNLTQTFTEQEGKLGDKVFADEKERQNAILKYRVKKYEELGDAQKKLFEDMEKLEAMRSDTDRDREDRRAEYRLSKLQELTKAELASQDLINKFTTEIAYAEEGQEVVNGQTQATPVNEAGSMRAQLAEAEDVAKYMQELDEKRLAYIAKQEREAKLKNNGILSKEEATRIQREAASRYKVEKENIKKLAADRAKEQAMWDKVDEATEERDNMHNSINNALHGKTTSERFKAMKELTTNDQGEFDQKKALTAAALAVSDLAKQLEGTIDEIGGFKKHVDTRLQGSSNKKFLGSYWDQLTRDMMSVGAFTPFFKQSDFANNIKTLVESGISFDLKQRAFLMTIQEKIANTFKVADGTLLRLIRIQQEDSTAGRLGMESAMTAFLNSMYENTEYLQGVAESVRGSLAEMESLLKGAEATEIEFQVQKWMGSLYSVGMSDSAVNAIAGAFGQIAAGQLDGLTGGGAGNLLIMAANDAGIPIADILTKGVNADETNRLLEATVSYLAEIAAASEDNRVVQQQLADVFGVKASDLRAAVNLANSMGAIRGHNMGYGDMLGQLNTMAGSMFARTSPGEMMSNLWENAKYSVAGSMASNPVSYMIYKVAKVLDDAAGGIDLPFLNVMGFGVDLNTTVSDLMRIAAVGTGLLGSLGPMISGLASSFNGQSMLRKLGIDSGSGLQITPRGDGGGVGGGGGGGSSSTSNSGYVGNSSGSDVKESTIQESEDSKKQQMIEAKEEEEENQVDVLNETVIKIYELLDDVASGKSTFTVKVEGYGLTKTSNKHNGALAGLDGIANAGDSGSGVGGGGGSGAGGGSSSGGGLNGMGAGSAVDFGGWVST